MRFSILFLLPAVLLSSCISYEYANKTENEDLILVVNENKDLYDDLIIPIQEKEIKARGLVLVDVISQALSLGTDLVKQAIDKEKSKYTREYKFARGHNYFYSELSTESPMDPNGWQFEGVEIVRMADTDQSKLDTALYIKLELDTTNITEIMNNSFFRMKVKEVRLNYAKVKIPDSKWYMPWTYLYNGPKNKKLNIDFELKVYSTWVSENTAINHAVEIGSFYFFLRDAVPGNTYSPELTGYSFFVPRSPGTYKNIDGDIVDCYGNGMYNLSAKITESWNSDFITTTVNSNSNQYVEDLSKMIMKELD